MFVFCYKSFKVLVTYSQILFFVGGVVLFGLPTHLQRALFLKMSDNLDTHSNSVTSEPRELFSLGKRLLFS